MEAGHSVAEKSRCLTLRWVETRQLRSLSWTARRYGHNRIQMFKALGYGRVFFVMQMILFTTSILCSTLYLSRRSSAVFDER